MLQTPETVARGLSQGLTPAEISEQVLMQQGMNLLQNAAMTGAEQMFPLLFGKKSNLDTESRLADNGNQSGDLVSAEDSKALKPLVNGPYIRNGKPYGRLKVREKAEIEML